MTTTNNTTSSTTIVRKDADNLTLKKRKRIKEFYYQGHSFTDIARLVKVSRTTISREIRKNGTLNQPGYERRYKYSHKKAHANYLTRMSNSSRFKDHLAFFHHFQRNYDGIFSFEQFYMETKTQIEDGNLSFKLPTLKTVYNWYHSGKLNFSKVIEHRIKKYRYGSKTYLKDPNRKSIHDRPFELDDYSVTGHYEIDLVISSGKKGGVLTMNHRATMKYYCIHVSNKRASTINKALRSLINKIGAANILSLTSDNGSEFCWTRAVERCYKLVWYKADPYCSGQRGQNERLNRDLRKFFPKGTNFENVSHSTLQNAVTEINKFPRKKFNGRSASYQEMQLP